MCANCKTFLQRESMARHSKICSLEKSYIEVKLISKPTIETSDAFKRYVIASLRNDDVGIICKTDPTILLVAYWAYQKVKKNDNEIGSSDSVRKDMRLLASLYKYFLACKPNTFFDNCKDIFDLRNFGYFREAITNYCGEGSDLKSGLKHNLLYVIISAAKTLKAVAYTEDRNDEAASIEKFLSVLNLWKATLFGDAVLQLKRNVETKARRPEQLPIEDDVQRFRDYSVNKVKAIIEHKEEFNYILLRNTLCARLTMFNARRGGEPARLTLAHLKDGLNDKWIDQQRLTWLDDVEKKLVGSMKVAFTPGKGNKLVPILFPIDTIDGLKIISDKNRRKAAGILDTNKYVFASTGLSLKHISGWHCIDHICKALKLPHSSNINATKNRHRVATLYSLSDLTTAQRDAFYDHMGHSENMNKQRYQCPPALREITKVGKFFMDIDKGKTYLIKYLIL